MKRSKIFLGITTGVLAVVAFTAAKSAKFSAQVRGYITSTASPANCTLAADAVEYYTKTDGNYAKTVDNAKTIFQYNPTGACVHPLYTVKGNQ